MFDFEQLSAWKESVEFADVVYGVTRGFPAEERFGLMNQMRRAAISVSANTSEGAARRSKNDHARFVEIACGSLYEVVSEATVAKRQRFLSDDAFHRLYQSAERLGRMLSGLRRSLVAD